MENNSTFQVYNASAGSGKTFSLVKEYLKIVLTSPFPDQFKHILAITFTNKAANEMKDRIINSLRQFAEEEILINPSPMFLKIMEETALGAKIIHQRAQKVLQQLLTQYGSFSVSTIDSFTHKLIRNFAFDLGLPINFDVELKSKNLLDLAVDNLIGQIGKDVELTDFLIDYALQNIEDNKSWDFTEAIKENAQVLLKESDRIHFQQTQNFDLHQFKTLNQQLFKRKILLENEFKKMGDTALKLIIENGVENDFSYNDLPNYFKKLIDFSSNHDAIKFEGRLFDNLSKEVFYTQKTPNNKKEIIDGLASQLNEIYFASKKLFENNYPHYVLSSMVSQNIAAFAVLNHLNKELQKLKKDKNILLSAEFNQLISDEIKNQPAPFIYEKLGTKFRHYFIDEMQDTSELQWQNLVPLIENALSQEGGSLMLVGDAKQSIYRWRGGKTEQFIELTSDGNSVENNPFYLEKELKNLDTNFRSFKTIVDFNNAFFSHISSFLENKNHKNLYLNSVFQLSKNENNGGYVQISFVKKTEEDEDNDQPFLQKIKAIIDNLDSNFNKNDVCVLVRKNKQGVAVANYLIDHKIQVVSSESLLIANNQKVDFIINLLTYLNQPSDEIVQFKLLTFLHSHLNNQDAVHDFISQFIKLEINQFFKHLQDLSIDFKTVIFFQKTLYDAIEYVIDTFKLAPNSDAYLQYFLDFVLDFQTKETNNLEGFLLEWERQKDNLSIVAPENPDAVRIMTVHKAKGLEFPIVIFPFDLEIRKEINGQTWISLDSKNEFNGLSTMKVKATQKLLKIGDVGEQLYQQRQDEIALDNFNLLYVAFTRAVEQLYVISEEKESKEIRFYSDLLKSFIENPNWIGQETDDGFYEVGNPLKTISTKSENEKELTKTIIQQQYIGASNNKQINIVTTASKWWGTAMQEAAIYGTKIHQLLAQINTEDDVSTVLKLAKNNGIITEQELTKLAQILNNIVLHQQLKEHFQHNITIYNEREILTENGEIIVPDRITINQKNEATIIDYKTGKESLEHENQINNYAFYVQKMGFKVISKLLIYINEEIYIKEVV